MKNLKINKNLSKKIISYVLVGTMGIFTLTGCSGKNSNKSLLEGTILENTNVVTFEDGTKDVVRMVGRCNADCEEIHKVYNSIVTDEYFVSSKCKLIYARLGDGYYQLNKYSIIEDNGIIRYLTNEEIVKASKEGLTEEDIANALNRIFTKEESKTK